MHKRHLDIQHPLPAGRQGNPRQRVFPNLAKSIEIPYVKIDRPEPERRNHFKIPVLAALVIFLLIVGFFGLNLARFKQRAETAAPIVHDNFKEGVAALLRFDLGSAKDYFQAASGELSDLTANSPLKTVPAILKNLFQISQTAVAFSEDLQNLEANGLAMIVGKKGAMVIKLLHDIQDRLAQISGLSSELKVQAAGAGYNVDAETGDVSSKFPEADRFLTAVLAWLEAPKKQRLLIFFQNPSEIRPGGGFIGSYALVDFRQGAIKNIEVPAGGSYDLQGSLRVNLRAPEPLQYVNPRFEFQDANWWPDFPTSAKKLLFLWEKSGGPTVDGVLAINASLFEKLLMIVGPVDLPAYGKRIDAQNFFIETQKAVELEYDRTRNTPKKFLRDLAEAVIARVGGADRTLLLPLALAFFDAVPEKSLQVYLAGSGLNDAIRAQGVSGAFIELADGDDTLRIVRTNIGGGKTDRVVRDAVTHETTINEDGEVVDRVVITRVHQGKRGELFTGTRSRDYLRLYVPKGALLLDADGFSLPTRTREVPPEEYADDPDIAYLANGTMDARNRVTSVIEGNRTFFGGWVELEPGEVKTMRLTYRLPFRLLGQPYRAHFERQSGMNIPTIMHRTLPPPSSTLTQDTLQSLVSPQPWQYDMTLLQTFSQK